METEPATGPSRPLRDAFHALRAGVLHAAAAVRDVALPPQCLACREPIASDGLCGTCWSKLSFIAPPFCPRLGIPFVYDPGPDVFSMQAIAHPPAYRRARAAVRYDEIARSLVVALKFQDRTDLAPAMGHWMRHAGNALLGDADALIPVPLHWRRGWSRRFNQSAALAGVIARKSGVPMVADALKRVRPTAHQIGLPRHERAANVQGAFDVPESRRHLAQGRRLVLVDDVITTGATIDACARALLRAGAKHVDVLVFARAIESHRVVGDFEAAI